MQWPTWAFWRPKSESNGKPQHRDNPPEPSHNASSTPELPASWQSNLTKTDWLQSHYTTNQTIAISIATTATTLALIRLYKTYLRRIPSVDYLKPEFFRRRSFFGYVTRVGDGDNFHLYHTPGGRLLGWGWLRRVHNLKGEKLKGKTMHVRIAGVDAPEAAHFGRPAQPYSQEALDWLRSFVLHKFVRVYPYRPDQYGRVVCSAYRRRWLFFKFDVGLNMLKQGLATVYEAKFGSEFGNNEEQYRAAEERAKQKKIGMWQGTGLVGRMLGRNSSLESPREYKTRHAQQEKGADKAK